MSNSVSESYFVDGGTLRVNTPSYVKRPADDELFKALMAREFCYILTPRQMGKSSLMIRISQRLRDENIKTAIVDIQGIGTDEIRKWYASLLSQIKRGLKLTVDIDTWIKQKSTVGFGQLFVDFIQDVVLAEIFEQVVIFLDEVDWMIKIDFRDEFFASIRSIYNARANYDEFNRVSFVLLGVASPADLISEPTRTPFNIGHAIPLQELSLEDATPLENGLEQVCPGEGNRILKRIFFWTNGHPYLTQKLCKAIAESNQLEWSDDDVDGLVNRLFLSEESRKEANLKFIQDRILNNEQFTSLLKIYKSTRMSEVAENGQSVLQNQLMLSGLLTSKNGYLQTRNRIYHTVFNDRWVSQNTPKNWQKITLATLGIITTLMMAIFIYDFSIRTRADGYMADFVKASSPSARLSQLANIYRLGGGIISNKNLNIEASQLFYTLPARDQLSMFTDYGIAHNPKLQDDLVVVVRNLHITLAYVNPENDNTILLQTMGDSLLKVNSATDNYEEGRELKAEIDIWLDGREHYLRGEYEDALAKYNEVIGTVPSNQATVFERALVYIALANEENATEYFANAVMDLDTTIYLAKQSTQQDEIDLTPVATVTSISFTETNTPTHFEQPATASSLQPNPTTSLTVPATQDLLTPSVSAQQTISPQTIIPQETVTPTPLKIPSLTLPPTRSPTSTPIPTLTPTSTPSINKFESRFTTFLEVYSAIREVIDMMPDLQILIKNNSEVYPNLTSVGFSELYSITSTPLILLPSTTPTSLELATTINSISFSPDGSTLATGGDDGVVNIWDLEGNNISKVLIGHEGAVNSVAFGPDGSTLASGSDDGTIILWNTATGESIGQPLVAEESVNTIAFSPDGTVLASGGNNNTLTLWDIDTKQPIDQLSSIKQASDTARIAYSSITNNIFHSGAVAPDIISIGFSPDGKLLASGSSEGDIDLWDLQTSQLIDLSIVGHESKVTAVTFSPNGRYLASGSEDSTLRVWDIATGLEIALMVHDDFVTCAVFSPDGEFIISGSLDGTIHIWEAATGNEVSHATDDSPITSVGISPDGVTVATSDTDAEFILWNISDPIEIVQIIGPDLVISSDFDAQAHGWGIDVSVYEPNVDWNVLKTYGMDFVFICATSGTGYVDPKFTEHWARANDIGIPRGAYLYFIADQDPIKQVELFVDTVAFPFGELPPAVFLEEAYNKNASRQVIMNNLQILLIKLEQLTGKRPILYSRTTFIESKLTVEAGQVPEWIQGYPLWLAQYPKTYNADTMPNVNMPAVPTGWNSWLFWQFSEAAVIDGITNMDNNPTHVNINMFHGSESDLLNYSTNTNSPVTLQPRIIDPTMRAQGIDVTSFQSSIDWSRVKNSGVGFMFVKATEGDYYADPTFETNWVEAKVVGISRGAYHFFRANIDPIKQADNFTSYIQSTGDLGELPPVLAIETDDGQSNEEIISKTKIWLDYVESNIGKKPIIYSSKSFFEDYFVDEVGTPPEWINDYGLWLAGGSQSGGYVIDYSDNMQPHLPDDHWSSWLFWQYSNLGRVDGINGNIPLTVFNGSEVKFQEYIISLNNNLDLRSQDNFTPRWENCSWSGIENAGIDRLQPISWCAEGSFLVGLDLDRCSNCSSTESPVVGQAQCCSLEGSQFNLWNTCNWIGVEQAGLNSHQPLAWCPEGTYLTGLDFDSDGDYDPMDLPVIGQAQCCSLPSPLVYWSSCQWIGAHISGINSHQPNQWCPNGSFLVGFDLDRESNYDPMDSPVLGQAYCCYPSDLQTPEISLP